MEIVAQKVKQVVFGEGGTHLYFIVTDAEGADHRVGFPYENCMGVAQYALRFFNQTTRQRGAVSFVETDAMQIHILGKTLGLEIAFGDAGDVNFEVRPETARKLIRDLEASLARIEERSPGGAAH